MSNFSLNCVRGYMSPLRKAHIVNQLHTSLQQFLLFESTEKICAKSCQQIAPYMDRISLKGLLLNVLQQW
ncbi:hypothetical protein XELAEV_18046167mg [Xenopus laevis]|uniref:Uncharacterized protein n=1 Tax=Xenopus laevis TaxID=8355 RepID=A0A974BSF1_XENLA|nr:hypothetical protein XELAEV_18046167mg [Xenopus laevis]